MKQIRQAKSIFIMVAACGLSAIAGVGYAKWHKSATSGNASSLLHAVIGPRFQTVNNRDFGMSRIVPKVKGHGHMGSLAPENETENRLLQQVEASPYEFRAGFIHTGYQVNRINGQPIVETNLPRYEPIYLMSPNNQTTRPTAKEVLETREKFEAINEQAKAMQETLIKTKATFETGHDVNFKSPDGWDVSVRPISAQRDTCVSCHTGIKKGKVMGAMVYFTHLRQVSDVSKAKTAI
jgi:hypothetical protein